MSLRDCIPKTKFDLEAIERARMVGFPAINAIIPNLLEWLQDANWPVADVTVELLKQAGPEIIEPVRKVLNSSDSIWKYWTIVLLVRNLDSSVFEILRPEIVELANSSNQQDRIEKVHIVAKEALLQFH